MYIFQKYLHVLYIRKTQTFSMRLIVSQPYINMFKQKHNIQYISLIH